MQPYLVYGFGIRAKNLPQPVRERLITSTDCFEWFYEDGAGSAADDTGIYYLVKSTAWSREDATKPDLPWADDLDSILAFKDKNESKVTEALERYDLTQYAHCVEFLCSVTEV